MDGGHRQRLQSKKSSCLECLSQTTKDMDVNTLKKDTNQTVYCYRIVSLWTITQTMKKQLDGCYTRKQRMALNVSWKQHIPNIQLYSKLPPVSTKVQQRRMRLAGHCVRHVDEVANKLVLWQPTDRHANRGRQNITYVDNLLQDTRLGNTSELQTVMTERGCWKGCVFNAGHPERRLRLEREMNYKMYIEPLDVFLTQAKHANKTCNFTNKVLNQSVTYQFIITSFINGMQTKCKITCF